MKLAANGSSQLAARGSASWPSKVSTSFEQKRVSRTNNPCAPPGRMSPVRSQMQNDDPCTRVTVVPLASATLSPAKSQPLMSMCLSDLADVPGRGLPTSLVNAVIGADAEASLED